MRRRRDSDVIEEATDGPTRQPGPPLRDQREKPPAAARRWRRWAALGLAFGAAACAAAVTVGAGETAPREPERRDTVGCYEHPDLEANTVVLRDEEIARADGAERACRAEWPQVFGRAAPQRLMTCVTPGGGQAVLPVPPRLTELEHACESVGAHPKAEPPPAARRPARPRPD